MDATFIITRFKAVKFITILSQDAQRQIFLRCVGILPGAESSKNITASISALKRAVTKVLIHRFPRLKYIVTDDSQASHNSLIEQFEGIHVFKCVWHIKKQFNRQLGMIWC